MLQGPEKAKAGVLAHYRACLSAHADKNVPPSIVDRMQQIKHIKEQEKISFSMDPVTEAASSELDKIIQQHEKNHTLTHSL